MSPSGPSEVEKPAPNDSSPVDRSATSTSILVLSGLEPGSVLQLDRLEEAEVLDALARAPQQGGVEGVAFGEPELAPDDLVEGAHIADDVDPLDVDPRALVDDVGQVDDVIRLRPWSGPD